MCDVCNGFRYVLLSDNGCRERHRTRNAAMERLKPFANECGCQVTMWPCLFCQALGGHATADPDRTEIR